MYKPGQLWVYKNVELLREESGGHSGFVLHTE